MFTLFKKTCGRASFWFLEAVLVVLVLALMAGGFVAWRLHQGALSLDFLKSPIESALSDPAQGYVFQASDITLNWPKLRGPIFLNVQDGRLISEEGKVFFSADRLDVGLHKSDLVFGKISPHSLVLTRPSLSVIRYEGNVFDFGLRSEGGAVDEETDGFLEVILEALGQDADERTTPLSKLKEFRIEDARVLVNDQILGLTWEAIEADFSFIPEKDGLRMIARSEVGNGQEGAPSKIDGEVYIARDSGVVDVAVQLQSFSLPFWGDKVPELSMLKAHEGQVSADFSARLDRDLQLVTSELKSLDFEVGDMAGFVSASLENVGKNINATYRIDFKDFDHLALKALWPQQLEDEKITEWVTEKISNGMFSNFSVQGNANIPVRDTGWDIEAADFEENLQMAFVFNDLDVRYLSTLPPVTGANGRATFNMGEERMEILVDQGVILNMDVEAAEIELINIIEAGAGKADVHIDLAGDLNDLLRYIEHEPLALRPDFDVENASGDFAVAINLGFPTRDDVSLEEFDIDIQGGLKNAKIPKLVQDLTFTDGPLAIRIDNEALYVDGQGQIENRPVSAKYKQFLSSEGKDYKSRVEASLRVDPNLRDRFGIDLSDFLEGSADTEIVYTSFEDGRAQADIKLDLAPARLFLEPFDYVKRSGRQASANMKVRFRDGALTGIDALNIGAAGLDVRNGRLSFRAGDRTHPLSGGSFPNAVVGDTQARVDFEISPSGLTKIVMDADILDARPFLSGEKNKGNYDAPPLQISVKADQMVASDGQSVRGAQLYIDIDNKGDFNQLEMDGRAGAGDIYLRYKPDAKGLRTFRFEADDAGAVLKAFDVYDQIVGGKLAIYGEPIRGVYDRNFIGRAEITDFKVVDAPTLARLLSAMSLPGLDQNLSGEGLVFTKLEANFDWLYRPEGSVLVLKEGRTSGNSLGLTFDGTFDNARNEIDVKGTIIPLSGVNDIIGSIPLLGDLLTGGTGSLIAATYTLKGQGDAPEVFVNPLSALTPGILRRILFEN